MVKPIPQLIDLKNKVPFLGLTGGIGSGKSSVAHFLAKLGAAVIDTDHIAHEITGPDGSAMAAISQTFGADYLNVDGSLNRPKMRQHVFSDTIAKKTLEGITHPLIRDETIRLAQAAIERQATYIVFVVPLLLESGAWRDNLDHIAVLDCSDELRIQRVMERSQLDRPSILQIMATQASREERLAIADTVLSNEGDLLALEAQAYLLHQKMLDL